MAEIQRTEQTQRQVATIPPEYVFQENGSIGTSETTINIGSNTASVLVKNTHASNSLSVKFRSGRGIWNTKAITVEAGGYLSVDIRTSAIKITGSGAATTYEIFATKE